VDAKKGRRSAPRRKKAGCSGRGYQTTFPTVEKMQEMGLSNGEIGLFFKFVGGAFCAGATAEGQEQKPSA
jgi:hypothetical protein